MRYRIYRGIDSTSMAQVDSTSTQTLQDVGLQPLTTYYYRVKAVDSSGYEGTPSYAIRATTTSVVPEAVNLLCPTDGASLASSTVSFLWHRPSVPVARYMFDIATDSLFLYHNIDSSRTDTSIVVTSVESGRTYWWRVRARSADGWGQFSPKRKFSVLLTDVELKLGVPKSIELAQNYPNPFNPSTTIRFGLPARSYVRLEVHNTLGQQVATLQDGEIDAGYHEMVFDGIGLPSGVYFYRMQAGSFSNSKKLLLIR
jgi:hypothetical protein